MSFDNNKKLTVINLWAGPGVGKSTTAAALFAEMKMRHMKVELLHETAKEYVWEKHPNIWGEQDLITAQQHRQLRRLVHHDIEFAINDAPLPLCFMYMSDWYPQSFKPFIMDVFNSYRNVNIYLQRSSDVEYQETGRNQNYEQACEIDRRVKELLEEQNIPYETVWIDRGTVQKIMQVIDYQI